MAGHSALKTRVNALVFPAIHVLLEEEKRGCPRQARA
jgi:hypothetical protein